MLSRFAGYISINWIPACAGMTGFAPNELFGFTVHRASDIP
jgi:hypothetical protein